ncbi:MAG: hypothetical protein HGB26_03025 [Desulfobulbaceae bacterium]|nr:hypothetical protein [Desulfobulbaceae bacterium]
MSGDTLTMSRADLTALAGEMAKQMAVVMQHQQALPEMYAFPEDIVKITKGKVPVNTIKYWRQMGWIKITKLGRNCFVMPEDWQYFVENYSLLKRKRPQ